MQGVVRTPRQLNNSALNQWLNQSISETNKHSGTTDCMADPVGRWMQDVRVMIELECMCVLQAKTFQSSAVDMAKLSRHKKSNIIRLRQKVCEISADFVNFYNNLDSTDLKDIRKLAIRLTNQIEKLVRNCLDFLYAQSVPFSISEKQEQVRRQSSMLLCHMENFNREGSFGTGVVPVLKTLSSLGHAFAGLAETIQSNLVRSLLEDIQGSASMYHLRVALQSLQSLTTDYKEISNIIIKEDGLQILCQICSINNVDAMKVDALRTIGVLCETQEARIEFEKANGIPVLAHLLSSESSIEVKAEVARILAQITSPNVDSIHHLIGFIEYLDDLLRELTELCKLAPSPSVFMVATAAISNITFMDSMSCDYLATYNTAEALLSGCKSGKAESLYCKDQIATTLANMVSSKACRQQVIDADGVRVLLNLLDEAVLPLKSINQEDLRRMHELCESVQQKALIALGRLAQTKTSAMVIIEIQGAKRLADLCYNSLERNNSDSVLLASLVALRRLSTFNASSGLDDMVIEQLIKPRITDSFLFCSKEKESFV
ncbi:protein inscuteable homolog [Anneissia japonica]|uniref:protein inscuteable homolog n=1 Tax=Anneissia japonica TaxID=1529436 RepID=UPI0014258FD2|nr:protein inscuteable homolog [Anneissia japonica]